MYKSDARGQPGGRPPADLTLDSGESGSPSESNHCCAKVELVAGAGRGLSSETQCLLQSRLRAATGLLLLAFGMYMLRRLIVPMPLFALHLVLITFLGASIVFLSRRSLGSMIQLRSLELLIFGSCCLFLAILHYQRLVQQAEAGQAAFMLAVVKSTVLYFFAMMTAYGMFIPNTWRRAACVVLPMAIGPVSTTLIARWLHPAVAVVAGEVATAEQISDNVIMMFMGATCAIFGTHIINTLRTQAFEARELGRYRLKQPLGAGGMGEVYLAEHQLLKRPCAIKLIRPEKAGNPTTLARFEREVRLTAKLSHPNTIDIYDYGQTEDGTFYCVMEYLPGMNLGELVDRYGPIPPERLIYLLRQICKALGEAHGIGLIHRDIKPANIFVAERGGMFDVIKLLDFGLVKTRDGTSEKQLTRDGSLAGSPLYMSPEQAMGDGEADGRSDIYSLGGVAYFALTGRPPFDGDHPMKILVAHARDEVVPPSKIQPNVPDDLEAIVLRCLAKQPSTRFQDVCSLEQSLALCEAAQRWGDAEAADWWQKRAGVTPRHNNASESTPHVTTGDTGSCGRGKGVDGGDK